MNYRTIYSQHGFQLCKRGNGTAIYWQSEALKVQKVNAYATCYQPQVLIV